MSCWKFGRKKVTSLADLPEGAVGFTYIIRNKTNGMSYVGKKNIYKVSRISQTKYNELKERGENVWRNKAKDKSGKSKKKKDGSQVWNYKTKSESNWLFYTGSNKQLNDDIDSGHEFEKEIMELAFCPSQLTYLETEALFVLGVLRDNNFYNDNIGGKFYKKTLTCNGESEKL
jgi:hypothetical protein